MGANASHNASGSGLGTQTTGPAAGANHTAAMRVSESPKSGSGSLREVWTDALAETSQTQTVETPKDIGVKHRGKNISRSRRIVANLLQRISQKQQKDVSPAPFPEEDHAGTTQTEGQESVIAGGARTRATSGATKDKRKRVASISTNSSARPPIEVPKRSSSLGKCHGSRLSHNNTPVGNSAYADRPLPEPPQTCAEPAIDVVLEGLSLRQQLSTRRALARITSGTFTCASPTGLSLSPIGNPYLPYGMGRDGITPYSPPLSTITTNTAEGSAVTTTATGTAEYSSTSASLNRTSPQQELQPHQTNHHNSYIVLNSPPKDKTGHQYSSFQGISDPGFSVTERHKKNRYRMHRRKSSPKEKLDKGKGKAKSPDLEESEGRVTDKVENLDGTPVDKDDDGGSQSTSKQSTPPGRAQRRHRQKGTDRRPKARKGLCPPEIFCALVWLDGPVPYSTDTEGEVEVGMERWERKVQAALRLRRRDRSEGKGTKMEEVGGGAVVLGQGSVGGT